MRRADKRSPVQVAIQRLTNLLALPDEDLCQVDHRTHVLPEHARNGPCTYAWLDAVGEPHSCRQRRLWALQIPGLGTRVRCTRDTATAIRARLWLDRRRYERYGG